MDNLKHTLIEELIIQLSDSDLPVALSERDHPDHTIPITVILAFISIQMCGMTANFPATMTPMLLAVFN